MESQLRKTVIGVTLAVLLAASTGYYLVYVYPEAVVPPSIPASISVFTNNIVVVGPFLGQMGGSRDTFYTGIWQLRFGNTGGSSVGATYTLFVNGTLGAGGSATLAPGQGYNTSACFGRVSGATRFDVSMFVSNETGIVVPHYPVTLVTPPTVAFSNQFVANITEASSAAHSGNPSYNVTTTNTGQSSIAFLFVELSNGTTFLGGTTPRCLGAPQLTGSPGEYSRLLLPGQSVKTTIRLSEQQLGASGSSLQLQVIALLSDGSEVMQTYQA